MQTQFTARHMEMTDAIKAHAQLKLEKLQRYMDLIVDAHVILSVEKYRHKVEVSVKGKDITVAGTEVSEDMYLSLDRVFDKIEKQLRRRKDRRVYQKRGVRSENLNEQVYDTGDDVVIDDLIDASTIVKNEIGDKIVESEVELSKPMGFEDALMQFKLINHDLFIFRNADEAGNLSVIYRRQDGGLSHILTK